MITEKLQKAINDQITAELWSSNLYLQMSFYMEKEGWGSFSEVFEHVYKHECHVSELIDSLVDIASSEKDKATQDFLWGYVREQVEEEATAASIVDKIKKAGNTGLFYLDAELGKR